MTRQTELAARATLADTWFSRAKGLLGRPHLAPGEGLIITRCRSVHMWWMRFPIDVVFLDRQQRVARLCPGLPPWSLSPLVWQAATAIELPVGSIQRTQTQVGDWIKITLPS